MTLLYALVGAVVVVAAGLVTAAVLFYRHLSQLRDTLTEIFGDYDAVIAAMKEDAIALDDELAELHHEVEAIKRNPLGPPVDTARRDEEDE